MLKRIRDVSVYTDNKENLYKENVLYGFRFPNHQVYYGSAKLLFKRLESHISHYKSDYKHMMPITKAIEKFKTFHVRVIKEFDTIEEARDAEVRFIRKVSEKIYEKQGGNGDFADVVSGVMLNKKLYRVRKKEMR